MICGVLIPLHVPAPELFGGLVAAGALALFGRAPERFPRPLLIGAQATLGVLIGNILKASTLRAAAADWFPIVVISVITLGATMAAGVLLGFRNGVTHLTGILALAAGGASAVTSISRELGADERVVAVVQFLRLAIVTISMPIVVLGIFRNTETAVGAGANQVPWYLAIVFLVICAAAGIPLGRLARLPAGALLGPMVISAVLSIAGLSFAGRPPGLVVAVAFGIIGCQAGLRFTGKALRELSRILPLALTLILGVIVLCAVLGVVLSRLTGVSMLEGYLATTPGGIYAVLAFAASTHSDVTFVAAVQVLRVCIMLVALPALAKVLSRRRPPGSSPG